MNQTGVISIAGYTRVSGTHQVKRGASLPNQEKMIRSYAKAHGYRIHKIYSDKGISGSINERPALMKMKEDSKRGAFKRVVFTHLDRFGRSAADTLLNYLYFEELGISLYSITEGVETSTPIGRLFRTILAALAEMETEQIRERMLVGRIERLRKGLGQSTRLFGYLWNKQKNTFEVIPEEATVYKRVVDDYLIGGKSQDEIAVSLNNDGIKSKFNRGWSQTSVGRLLKNPAYKGKWVYTILGERFEVDLPPLIDGQRWQDVQRRIRENYCNGHARDDKNQHFLLRKLLQCGVCQSGIYPYVHRKRKVRPRYYACRPARPQKRDLLTGKRICYLPYILTTDLERCVYQETMHYFLLPDRVMRLRKNRIDPAYKNETYVNLIKMRHRLRLLRRKIEEYRELLKEKSLDPKDVLEREAALDSSIEYLKSLISEKRDELLLIKAKEEELREVRGGSSSKMAFRRKIEKAFMSMTKAEIHGLYQAAFGERKLMVCKPALSDNGNKSAPAKDSLKPSWSVKGVEEMNFDAAAQYFALKILGKRHLREREK